MNNYYCTFGDYLVKFYGESFTSFELPAGLEYIGQFAAANCGSLTEVIINKDCKLKAFDSIIFYDSKKLTAFKGESEYLISPLGHMVASELQGSLHNYIREQTRISALRRLSLYRRGAEASCTVTPSEDGKYTVRCQITEKGESLLDVCVSVLSEKEAQDIKKHFSETPEEVCRGILSVLTGKLAYYMS